MTSMHIVADIMLADKLTDKNGFNKPVKGSVKAAFVSYSNFAFNFDFLQCGIPILSDVL